MTVQERNDMNFNHLEYALEVLKAGSIRKASQNLFMSQPYLSGMIKGLEDELGYRIFNRTAAGITLTPEGEQFTESARLILLELRKMKEVCKNQEERQLNISCYYSTYIMEKFLMFHNASTYKFLDKIKEMGNEEVLEAVSSGRSSIGFIFYAQEKHLKYMKMAEKMGLSAKELLKSMEVYAFMHKSHPMAQTGGMKTENLCDYPYVSYDDNGSKSYLNILGIKDHPQLLEVSDRGSFYDALRSGEYLTSMACSKPRDGGEFVTLPFLDKKSRLHSSYVTTKNYSLSKREKEFLKFIGAANTD